MTTKPEEGKPICTECGYPDDVIAHHPLANGRGTKFGRGNFYHPFEPLTQPLPAPEEWPVPAPEETTRWIHEDELPKGYPYEAMYPFSRLGIDGLGGCRIFPEVKASSPSVEPAPGPCLHLTTCPNPIHAVAAPEHVDAMNQVLAANEMKSLGASSPSPAPEETTRIKLIPETWVIAILRNAIAAVFLHLDDTDKWPTAEELEAIYQYAISETAVQKGGL